MPRLLLATILITLTLTPTMAGAVGSDARDYSISTPQTDTTHGILPACVDTGACTLCDLLETASNAVSLMTYLAGGVALGFMLWIAFGLVGSRGNAEAVKGGKDAIFRIAIGLFFLLLAWELVFLVLSILSGGKVKFPPWKGITCPAVTFK